MGIDSVGYNSTEDFNSLNQEKNEPDNSEKEKAMVGTLVHLVSELKAILEKYQTRNRRSGYELSINLRKEIRSLSSSEFLDYFNEKQKKALIDASRLIQDALLIMSDERMDYSPENETAESEKTKVEIIEKINAAKVIVDLIWELQPKKTYADFGEK